MKDEYVVYKVSIKEANNMLDAHHYLHLDGHSKTARSGYNVGLYYGGIEMGSGQRFGAELVGVCLFTPPPVPEIMVGAFGLAREDQQGFYELSRLVLDPKRQAQEHNLASWFVSRALKSLCKNMPVRAVLSYADADYHSGTVYAACNFTYHGLTDLKMDYYDARGKYSRGSGTGGEWRARSRKHRFLRIYDPQLSVRWPTMPWSRTTD